MRLADTDITKFQALYKSELGMEISREEALEKGIKLLSLMSAIWKPMTEAEYKQIQKHRQNTLPSLIEKLNNC